MYKALIVEDDPMVAMINEQYVLKNKSFSVCGKCKDGISALEFLKNESVDLIIMDVYMPKIEMVKAKKILHLADEICPYSKAIRNNVEVGFNIHVD